MRKIRRCSVFLSLAAGLLIAGAYFVPSFAEETSTQVYYPGGDAAARETCLRNFDINNVDFRSSKVVRYLPLLAEYFQCRAAVRDSIKECNNLDPWPDRLDSCTRYFDIYQGFYGRLLSAGSASPKITAVCVNALGLSREDCQPYAKAWLDKDISFCERLRNDKAKYNSCVATFSGNTKACSNDRCADAAVYSEAIKSGNIKGCAGIKNTMIKAMCVGYISADEKICEKNKDFEEFRSNYCK